MRPHFRKFMLTAHIIFSVGWLGAVTGFLALSIAGLTSQDIQLIRSAYLAMELIGWFVIVPSCFGALLTGLVLSLGTSWGLFRHYWVLVKFFLTIGATILLLLHMQPISYMAEVMSETTFSNSEHRGLQVQLVADATAAFLVLLVNTILSVYKPWGRTSYGFRKQQEHQKNAVVLKLNIKKSWRLFVIFVVILVLLLVIRHLSGGGLGGH